ncbi:META domain-containing protein [Hydrogenophaga pseudoflava]|uniref:META domain-containing protein n=1 Tax=Hydrogenophaga pseudoflava TaxID=47421 RepID=UPI0027E44336|nr:META domain-containing protein [Hydrogenophaga pseudoflava]MDQ7743341.1 META domain-containing protein [Hydrogenophaga pseudoflava]
MPLHTSRFLSIAALAVAGTLGACAAPAPAPAPEPLWGSEWQLQSIGSQAALPQPAATLVFAQTGQAAGHGSCNRFSGTVEIDRDRLKFGPLMSTKMACLGGASEQESRYLGALQKAQRYELQGDTLLIHAQGLDQPLRLVRTAPRK